MISCIIVDDDHIAIEELREHLSNIPQLDLIECFSKPLEAISFLNTYPSKIGILFSDVEMPVMSGLELASLIRNKVQHLIFTTSHSKFALDAFDVTANAYLLKPFSLAKVLITLGKFYPDMGANQSEIVSKKDEDYIFVKSKEDNLKLVKVLFSEIVVVESYLNYVKIHTEKKN